MRRFLISIVTAVPMAIAIAGCTHDTKNDSNGTMKMSAPMACCGDACKKMGDCCKADDKGKVTCSMGGNCCVSSDKMKM